MNSELEKIVHEAGTAYSEGRFEDARQLYEKAILAYPSNGILYANLSAILLKLKDVPEALRQAERAVQISPNWAKAHYRKGEALKRANNLPGALLCFCNGTRLDPSNFQILKSLLELACDVYSDFPLGQLQSLGLDSDRSTVLSTIGQQMILQSQFPNAITVLGWALSLEPKSLKLRESTLSSLAAAHCHTGSFARAIDYYEQQLEICKELGGDLNETRENMALAAEQCGKFRLASLQRSLRINSQLLTAREEFVEKLKVADNYINMRRCDDALALLDECSKHRELSDEDSRRLQTLYGFAKAGMGDNSGARSQLLPLVEGREAPMGDGDDVDGWTRIIDVVNQTYISECDVKSSMEFLNRMLRIATRCCQNHLFAHCCCLLCQSQIANGNCILALKLAKRILKFSRSQNAPIYEANAYRLLATIYEQQCDKASSIVLWKKFVATGAAGDKNTIEAFLTLARLSEGEGSAECPKGFFDEAVRLSERTGDVVHRVSSRSARFRWLLRSGKLPAAADDLSQLRKMLADDLASDLRSLIFEDVALYEKEQGTSNDSIYSLEQSLTEAQDGNNVQREMQILERIGDALLDSKRFRQAEGYYAQQLEVARQLRSVRAIADANRNLCRTKLAMADLGGAAEHARNGLTVYKMVRDNERRIEMLVLVATAESRRNNYDVAMTALEKAIGLAEECDASRQLAKGYRQLADIYAESGQDVCFVMDNVKRHISLFEYEDDVGDKCRSLLDFHRFEADNSMFIDARQGFELLLPLFDQLDDAKRVELLIEAGSIFGRLPNGVEMAVWAFQRAMVEFGCHLDDKETLVENVARALDGLPKMATCTLALSLAEIVGFPVATVADSRRRPALDVVLLNLAAIASRRFVKAILAQGAHSPEIGSLVDVVMAYQVGDWKRVDELLAKRTTSTTTLLDSETSLPFEDGTCETFFKKLQIRSSWAAGKCVGPDFFDFDEKMQCDLFDMFCEAPNRLFRGHEALLGGDFDMLAPSHGTLEKIICAAFCNESDLIQMWFDELLDEYDNNSDGGLVVVEDPIFTSRPDFQLKTAAIFVALTLADPVEQIAALEKYHAAIADHLVSSRVSSSRARRAGWGSATKLPEDMVYAMDNESAVQVFWVFQEGELTKVVWSQNEQRKTFYDHLLVNLLRDRGREEVGSQSGIMTETVLLVSTFDADFVAYEKRAFWLRDHSRVNEVATGRKTIDVLNLDRRLDPEHHNVQANDGDGQLLLQLQKLAGSQIAIVDVAAFDVPSAFLLAAPTASNFVLLRNGALSDGHLRNLFVLGTKAVFLIDASCEEQLDEHVDAVLGMGVLEMINQQKGIRLIHSNASNSAGRPINSCAYLSTMRNELKATVCADYVIPESINNCIPASVDFQRLIRDLTASAVVAVLSLDEQPTATINAIWRLANGTTSTSTLTSNKSTCDCGGESEDVSRFTSIVELLRANPDARQFFSAAFTDHIYDYKLLVSAAYLELNGLLGSDGDSSDDWLEHSLPRRLHAPTSVRRRPSRNRYESTRFCTGFYAVGRESESGRRREQSIDLKPKTSAQKTSGQKSPFVRSISEKAPRNSRYQSDINNFLPYYTS